MGLEKENTAASQGIESNDFLQVSHAWWQRVVVRKKYRGNETEKIEVSKDFHICLKQTFLQYIVQFHCILIDYKKHDL